MFLNRYVAHRSVLKSGNWLKSSLLMLICARSANRWLFSVKPLLRSLLISGESRPDRSERGGWGYRQNVIRRLRGHLA
jgi:hypothetical protein